MKTIFLAAAAVLPMVTGTAHAATRDAYTIQSRHAGPSAPAQVTMPEHDRISNAMPAQGNGLGTDRQQTAKTAFNPFLNAGLNGGGG